jgi:ABC1 family protein
MPDQDDALRQLDSLVQVALRVATSAPSGRIALAKLAASIDPSWMPPPWDKTIWPQLVAARQAAIADELPFKTVEGVLRSAWGSKWSDELDSLESSPVAVTPSAQVHRGVLDGNPVAVKVMKPGLVSAVRQDLSLLDTLLGPLRSAFPAIDPAALVREARERVMDELDLEHEATVTRQFDRALRGADWLVVPTPVGRLSHQDVIVTSWLDGKPLSAGVSDPDAVATSLVRFVLGGLRIGLVHADLDLDDVLVMPDGRLGVLDFGAVAPVIDGRVDHGMAVVDAFTANDGEALGRGLQALGLLDADRGPLALSVATAALGPLGKPAPALLDVRAVVDLMKRVEAVGSDAVTLLVSGGLEPADLWPGRAIGHLFSVIARIGATASWPTLVRDALELGWSQR